MKDYVTDTHALYWYLAGSPKLGMNAKNAFDEALNGEAFIHISTIVLAELFFLNVKHKLPIDFTDEYKKLNEVSQFVLTSIEPEDIVDFKRDQLVTEMHDRIIVGLARRLGARLISADKNILESRLVEIIW